MKNIAEIKSKITGKVTKLIVFVDKHRLTVLIVVVGAAISYVSYTAQSYLDPKLDQAVVDTKKAEVNFKTIDEDFVKELSSSTNEDTEVDITQNSGSGRENPFSE